MDGPLRILFLSNRGFLPIKDGHSRRSFNILKGLAEKNQVYFLSLSESQDEINQDNIQQLKYFCHQVEFIPSPPKKVCFGMILRVIRSLFSIDPYTVWRHYSKPFLKRVDELISSGQFDLVHCDILPICYTVRDRKDIFCSVTDHDVSYLKCLGMGRACRSILLKSFLYLEALKLRRLERNIFRQVDLGIVVSELDKGILQKLCPEGNFLVVENGVDLDKFKPSVKPQEDNKLLWLGGFDQYPNRQGILFFLRNIYPLVKKEVPSVRIDILGGGVTEELMKFVISDSSINFTGYVEDPLPYIHGATVFVAPILTGGGTKLKVLEAMAAGKAIVSTTVGCEGIDGIHGHHYLIADEEHGFAKAVVRLLNNESLRDTLQINARNFVCAGYDYDNICRKLDLYYKYKCD